MKALAREIKLCGNTEETVETVYFGGGTPSILRSEEINELLKQVNAHFNVTVNAEITLEANPDDINEANLQAWKASGINRLSIGVQSFFEEDLQWMNRAHNATQAFNNVQLAIQSFDNITIDLIYGVPGLSNERWLQNIETAVGLGIPHLSCYALTVEPRTPLDKLIRNNKKPDVNSEHQADQFLMLMDRLQEAGYEHYEISSFARPGYRSRHNSSYWQGKNYVGIGPGAHSYNGAGRSWNVANNQKYIDSVGEGLIPCEKEELTETQKLNEYIMTALRTMEGIDLKKLKTGDQRFLTDASHEYILKGHVILTDDRLRLTREGKLFADGIAAELFR